MIDNPHAAPTENATSEKATAFHWFQGASVQALVDRLIAADPATARLEVHQHDEKMYFRVVAAKPADRTLAAADGDPTDPINDSHRCPPECPT
ncbi:MAG TPA: hypothetical protein VIR54_27055 [Vicinamibacterales bacterium]|jgi:hypothetical protein